MNFWRDVNKCLFTLDRALTKGRVRPVQPSELMFVLMSIRSMGDDKTALSLKSLTLAWASTSQKLYRWGLPLS